ncbi:right-handed parallel beta-helix repeat-containing protein [Nonomuraea sp. NPDC050022]|uniref:right-handed parallel beta-helix repeat-containing protein n=1 Tax=unclassified Nonomuraea TaxID=2593643 RepID=UPI0033CA4ED3
MTVFHVDPSGDDSWPGTAERPFASLHRARDAVRDLVRDPAGTVTGDPVRTATGDIARDPAVTATGDVIVQLRAGTHVLTAPFELTEADSGRDGHRIVYQAHGYGTADQEEVVVSGGREITGWRIEDGVWLADVGDLDTRQLYVDGRRVERAAIDGLPGTVTMTETGYESDSAAPRAWHNPADVEFVYRGVYPWTEARCSVAAIAARTDGGVTAGTDSDAITAVTTGTDGGEASVITMAQPGFGWALDLYNSAWEGNINRGPGLPTRVENDVTFLTEPGTFVLDRSRPGHHVLRYLPLPEEAPDRTRVVAPVLETLLRATGTSGVSFRGLVFADATWLRPGRAEGFLHYHGSGYYEGGPVDKVELVEGQAWVTVPRESARIPACVVIEDAVRVAVERCRFTRMGAAGLELTGGTDVSVRGCDFDTLSAGAVSVTGAVNPLVEDNWIHHTGLEFTGSPGIAVLGTKGCTVAHNQVEEVPHCGIVAGPAEGTRILRNLTVGTMGVLADGGGVYLSGPQGDSHENGAVIRGNVIKDTRTPYNFALYTDYGAAWVTVEDNVVARADNTAVLQVAPPLDNVVYRGNFWDADPVGVDDVPAGVTYEDNTTLPDEEKLAVATAAIQRDAGLLHPRSR